MSRRRRPHDPGEEKRRLVRRYVRGDPNVQLWEVTRAFGRAKELVDAERRRQRANERYRQSTWLRLRRAEMEDILEENSLPRDVWRAVWFEGVLEEEPEPLHHAQMILPADSALFRWFRGHQEGNARVHWAAATAWAAGKALETRSPERRFVFGRLIEAFYANLLFPGRVEPVVKAIRREGQSKGGGAPKRRQGIYAATVEVLRRKPGLTAAEVWERIPSQDGNDRGKPVLAAGFEVYRAQTENGERLCQANGPGPDSEITAQAFRRYVTDAKKELRSVRSK